MNEEDLEKRMNVSMAEMSELGEVTKEFSENKPSSSNLTADEHRLWWRGVSILQKMSPRSVIILENYMDSKRSVGGWNTMQKVSALTGVQQARQGIGSQIMGMFKPKE